SMASLMHMRGPVFTTVRRDLRSTSDRFINSPHRCVGFHLTLRRINQIASPGPTSLSLDSDLDRLPESLRLIFKTFRGSKLSVFFPFCNSQIEKFFPHILEKEKSRLEAEPAYLSPQEYTFAKEYAANCETYLKSLALRHMPPNLQALDFSKAVPRPNLDSFVFLRVKERQENVLVEPETEDQR
ncbi:hypothetical protein chiPu_0021200, partial [Chiloscyllium punctatum]|nr:hypothetical protein [Chiloscyllium punctatum]